MLNISGVCSFLFPITDVISIVPLKLTHLDDSFPFGGNLGLFSVAFWLVLGDRTTVDIRNSFSFTPFCLPSLRLDWTHPSRVRFFSPKTELQPWDWRSPRLTYISPRLGTRNTCASQTVGAHRLSPVGNGMAFYLGIQARWVHIIPLGFRAVIFFSAPISSLRGMPRKALRCFPMILLMDKMLEPPGMVKTLSIMG